MPGQDWKVAHEERMKAEAERDALWEDKEDQEERDKEESESDQEEEDMDMDDTPAPTDFEYAVIIDVCDPEIGGNMSSTFDVMVQTQPPNEENNFRGVLRSFGDVYGAEAMFALRAPVFTVGEILIVNPSGREINGRGRMPSKWEVEFEIFDGIVEAVERSQQATDAYVKKIAKKHAKRIKRGLGLNP